VHGLPDDLFEDLMEMMVPPGDFARRGEVLAKQTKRTKYESRCTPHFASSLAAKKGATLN